MGTFDPKDAIPKDDRLEFYQRQWEREPKVQTFYRSGERGYEDFTFQVTRTQADVSDPEKNMRKEINNFVDMIVVLLGIAAIATVFIQFVSVWQEEEEMNEIQRKKSA